MTTLSLPIVGFGPPKVSDDLYVWLVARDEPDQEAAARAVATLPPDLADWIRPTADDHGGSVGWAGPVLCLHTGYGVRYYAQTLEPGHLAWLPDTPELSDADIERILDEVMDGPRKGPRPPKDEAWLRLGAQLTAWFRAVHDLVPLWLVVVGRKVKPPGPTRHRQAIVWVEDHLDDVVSRATTLREAHGTSYAALGWTGPLASGVLAKAPAKTLSEATRWSLLRAIDGSGLAADAQGTALLNAWPKRARAAVLARLLREGHDLGLLWLAGKSTHDLLLDDEVFQAAESAPRGLLSPYIVDQAMARYHTPKKGVDRDAWLTRFVAAASPFANEHLEAPAAARPDDRGAQADLADWRALRGLVS